MRRWLPVVVVVVALGASILVVRSPAGVVGPPPAADAGLPTFAPVPVRAEGKPGLALWGTVRDPQGRPVEGATVGVTASGQVSLATHACPRCGEPFLSCRSPHTHAAVAELLDRQLGGQRPGETVTTDAEGRFRFARLDGTSFTVTAVASGLGEAVKEQVAPLEPVELFLTPPRRIAGRLADEAGAPVRGVVRAVSQRSARVTEVVAGEDGRFEVSGLGEGPFHLSATAQGLLPASKAGVPSDATGVVLTLREGRSLVVAVTRDGAPAGATVILQGDHLGRELPAAEGALTVDGLPPGPVVVSATAPGGLAAAPREVHLSRPATRVELVLVRGGLVSVSVVDGEGRTVSGARVEVATRSGQVLAAGEAAPVARLGPLAPQEVVVKAAAPGHREASLPVTLEGEDLGVELTLQPATEIAGRVIDEYGRPAPGISVLVTPTGDSVRADAEGRFVAQVPSPGLYTLAAHHSDHGGGQLEVSAPARDVELQLDPRATLEVTVTAAGQRVEGAHVTAFHREGSFRSDRASGADGVVLMRGLDPARYLVVASHPGFLSSGRIPVELTQGGVSRLEVELKAGAAVSGQVVDTAGAPVGQVLVGVSPRSVEGVVTSADGRFELAPLRPGGTYRVSVTQKGFEQVEPVKAVAGKEPVRLVVRRQTVFTGRVVSQGRGLSRFRVNQLDVTSPDGRFSLPLPEVDGMVAVTVEAPGYEPTSSSRPASPDLGVFELAVAKVVTGTVRDQSGAPVADAVVSCASCEQQVLSQPDGRYRLGKPPRQSEFRVVARKGARSAARTVLGEATQEVDLVLGPAVHLTGRAYEADGSPAAGVPISAIQVDSSESVQAVTGADGAYVMDLVPGIHRLSVGIGSFHRQATDAPVVIADLQGEAMRLDLGGVPGRATVTVRIAPRRGWGLWLVRGAVSRVGNPPSELSRVPYAQFLYQPVREQVTFAGLEAGVYTLVWGSFHEAIEGGPVVQVISVTGPTRAELVR